MDIRSAIRQADIIVLAIWFDATAEFLRHYTSELVGKIIVDPSNPIAPDDKGGFIKIIEKAQSAGQINATLLPQGTIFAS